MRSRLSRREIVLGALALGAVACSKKNGNGNPEATAASGRCEYCGMTIDPKSAWRAEVVDSAAANAPHGFDCPKCALTKWREAGSPATQTPRFQEFYSRAWRNAGDVVFVVGSDAVGPMGMDAVPVDRASAANFVKDHGGSGTPETLELAALTLEKLKAL